MSRPRRLHALWLLVATLVAIAVLAPAAAVAQPAPATTLSISGQADFVSPNQINVYVVVQGTGGLGSVFVQVQQANPPFATQVGNGSTGVICDGQRRTHAVSVFGFFSFPGWQLGNAEAAATAFCPTSGSDFDTRSIRITRT
jgi:hypothetical protein